MSGLIDVLLAAVLCLAVGVPFVMLLDKWKKEMYEEEGGEE